MAFAFPPVKTPIAGNTQPPRDWLRWFSDVAMAIKMPDYVSLTPTIAPNSPTEGMIYADKDSHHLMFYNGTDWVQIG